MFSKGGDQSSQNRHMSEQSQDLESIQEGERSNEKAKRKKKGDKNVLKKAIETKNLVSDYDSIIKMQESPFFGEKHKAVELLQGSPF